MSARTIRPELLDWIRLPADREDFALTWVGPVAFVSDEHDIRPERSRRDADRLPLGSFHQVRGVVTLCRSKPPMP